MSLVNLTPWMLQAQHEHFAIGAFNANTMEQVQAIVAAAADEHAPAIIQVSHRALLHVGSGNAISGLRYMAAVGRIAAESVPAPVALHIDHATEREVLLAMGLGFTSVMFDGGNLPFDENVRITKELRELALSVGVSLEAEVGEVPRADAAGHASTSGPATDPAEAAAFVRATGIDALAVAIGSVHAIKQKSVAIDLGRLRAIREAVSIPLVLHGSSGVIDDYIRQGIVLGLCKVNIATQLSQAFTRSVRSILEAQPEQVDPRQYLGPARAEMKECVRERIRFLGAAGKA